MLDAWRSGRFVTYPKLPHWDGPPWSLLLTPGWRGLNGRSLAEIVARQWSTTVDVLLDDLGDLGPDRWCVASYDQLVSDPRREIERICEFLDVEWDDDLAEPLPHSRHTLDSPHPEKWRRNADELEPHVDMIAATAQRASDVFATAPRTAPVRVVEPVDEVATASPGGRRPTAGGVQPFDGGAFRVLAHGLVPCAPRGSGCIARDHDLPSGSHDFGTRRARRRPQLPLPSPPDAHGRCLRRTPPRRRHPFRDPGVPESACALRALGRTRPSRRLLRGAATLRHRRHPCARPRVGSRRPLGGQHPIFVSRNARPGALLRAPVATAVRHRARCGGPLSPQRARHGRRRATVGHRARADRRGRGLARAEVGRRSAP